MRTLVFEELTFSAAHYLPGHEKCSALHGHTYFVRNLEVACNKFVDIGDIKNAVKSFDHMLLIPEAHVEKWIQVWSMLSDMECEAKTIAIPDIPTVENISIALARALKEIEGVEEVAFELYEGPNQGVAYP